MGRLLVRPLAIVATLAALTAGGCSGFKMAGSVMGSAGAKAGAGGAGGKGGAGGAAGNDGGAGSGGSTGGKDGPVIIIDAGTSDHTGNPDLNCGAKSKTAMKVAPDVLILLDRSGSMNDDTSNMMCRPDGGIGGGMGCGPESKWAKTIPAITQVVSETEMEVNWGLKFFPDNSGSTCNVSSTAAVDVAPGNSNAIAAAIMGATSTNGGVVGYNGTPTRAAETGAAAYLATLTDIGPKFILLATDGLPTCAATGGGGTTGGNPNSDDSAAAPGAVEAARTAGFKTFVVGISTGGGAADATLSNMATAGGLARSGTPSYYAVNNTADLAAAIRTLIGVAATCTFQIGKAPTDDGTTSLEKIDVLGDGMPITRDTTHTNGYDYIDASMQSIQVYGPLCDQIMSGAIHEVAVTFRCLVP